MKSNNPVASVFIPTYNGERYIEQILEALLRQKVDYDFEVLVIDSGSKDKTVDIVKRYARKSKIVRLHEIPNSEFGHGKTRNLAARMCRGEYIVYLSHDAVPAHDKWLYEMTKPFELHDKIVAVLGKQEPRHDCFPLMKYDIRTVFSSFGPNLGISLFYRDYFVQDKGTKDFISFYSDVNSASRRKFLLDIIPYRDVKYAEDQMFGIDIIEGGYIKAYAPRGCVIHSNDMKIGEYRKRIFDETIGLRRIGHNYRPLTKGFIVNQIIGGIIKDSVKILHDRDYSRKRKIYWLLLNPIFHLEKWQGLSSAISIDLNNSDGIESKSLESSRSG